MASLRELIIKISANSSSFQTEISRASRMGADYYKTMEQGNRKAEYATRQSQRALADLNGQLATVRQTALGMAGAFAGAFATGHLINLADQWNQVNARLKQASQSSEDFSKSQQSLMAISQRTGTAFGDNASLFARSAASMREFGFASDDVLKVTEAISTGLKLSGAGTQEASSVITQFSQALAQGVLRGEEFNSVNENGDRVIRALAAGMGVARKDLKAMADQGLLSIDKVVPALLSQLGTLQSEFAAMPSTVSGSITKVENAFQQWVGSINETSGVTATLSGSLDSLAGNIDNVAAVLGALVAVGAARYFGGLATSIASSTAATVSATRNQLALAAAQRLGAAASLAQISTEREMTLAVQKSLVAQLELAQTEKTRLAIRNQLSANSAALASLTRAEAAATETLATAQSRLNIAGGLASKALGLIGGPAGAAMLAGTALYFLYEKTEQSRQAAIALADQMGTLSSQIRNMTQAQLALNQAQLRQSLEVQKEPLQELVIAYQGVTVQVERYQAQLAKLTPGTDEFVRKQRELTAAQDEQTIAQSNLQQARDRFSSTQNQINMMITQQTTGLRENYVEIKNVTSSLPLMTAEGSRFNSVLMAGNVVLRERNALLRAPMAIPQNPLTSPQEQLLQQASRERELSTLTGSTRVRKQAEFTADDKGLTNSPENQKARKQYIDDTVAAWTNQDKLKSSTAAAGSEAKKTATITGDYQQKIANLNKEIQVERVRLKEGDVAASLFSASMETGSKWTGTQRAELERLNKTLTEAKQRWDDHNAAISSDPYRQASQTRKESEAQLQRQIAGNEIKSAEELARRKQEINTTYLNAVAEANQRNSVTGNQELAGNVDPLQNIENQLAKRQALIETYATAGVISEQRKNQLILASENETNEQRYQAAMALYSSQGDMQKLAVDLFQSSQERVTNMLTGMLTGTQTFKESMLNLFSTLTQSIIKNLVDMAAQALITSTIMQTITGIFGGVAGGAAGGASAAAGSTGAMGMSTSYMAYAKGGVVASSDLSQFSGQVVSTPTTFAFAKGAGLMGEAGPEAIMPLTRAADGSLGVRAISQGGVGGGGGGAPQVYISIDSNGQTSQTTTPGWEQFGSEIGQFVDQRYRALRDKDLGQNGVLTQRLGGRR
ncbi:tail length tape measure protein [Serratia liquefaciens]|uniref:tape measure protein n=1 Tax=Serratia liquefaciens TaxID=614 RepID=UPI000D522F2B|nr:tape measure protein [Serratia liquefaciens]PVD43495.1 tail length tape measure protein [Serratia liquefaciens]QHT52378.1 phage tail tape measure protein [Serratia liquefaciens]